MQKPPKYLYDHPDIPGKKVSRQRLWQINKRKEGKCPRCGGKRRKGKQGFCHACDRKLKHPPLTSAA